jgi:hypothetical protein
VRAAVLSEEFLGDDGAAGWFRGLTDLLSLVSSTVFAKPGGRPGRREPGPTAPPLPPPDGHVAPGVSAAAPAAP